MAGCNGKTAALAMTRSRSTKKPKTSSAEPGEVNPGAPTKTEVGAGAEMMKAASKALADVKKVESSLSDSEKKWLRKVLRSVKSGVHEADVFKSQRDKELLSDVSWKVQRDHYLTYLARWLQSSWVAHAGGSVNASYYD